MPDRMGKQIMVIGLPASGKTSFLAALQNYIDSELEPKSVSMYRYSSNSEYLNKVHEKWLTFIEQNRTIQEQPINSEVVMHLEILGTKEKIDLNVPDVAGEHFSQQWKERYWEMKYKDLLETADGLLLFIHPDSVLPHASISDILPFLDAFINDEILDNEIDGHINITAWDPKHSPTQVIITDLLQAHLEYIYKGAPVPISIIISAWDSVEKQDKDITPYEWVKISMPLLYQYLTSNKEMVIFEVFGVSAQGGNLKNRDELNMLQNIDEPAKRVIVRDNNTTNHDIGAPIISILKNGKRL
jgi:hypothetical protein